MVGMFYGLVSSNFFWGYIVPAFIVYLCVNNKDEIWGKESYDKGMRKREWVFVLTPYINFFGGIFFIGMFVIKGIMWLLEGFLDDKRNH